MAGKRILLVDDEENILEVLGISLRSEGYIVDTANSLRRGLASLSRGRYELVATDFRLPDGDGTLLADRAAEVGIKTLIFSGYLHAIPAEEAKRHLLLSKPILPDEFVAAVERRIGKADPA
jgi:two-component system, NtrC family, response regulator GlrR